MSKRERKATAMVAADIFEIIAAPKSFVPGEIKATWATIKPGEKMIYWRDTGDVIPGRGPMNELYTKVMDLAASWDARLHIQRVFDRVCHVAIKR